MTSPRIFVEKSSTQVAIQHAIYKGWIGKSNREIVREAAAKGSNIELAQQFLAERLQFDNEEMSRWFRSEVNTWALELLLARQVFKASHILKNAGLDPVSEMITMACEQTDTSLRDCIVEQLGKTQTKDQEVVTTITEFINSWNLLRVLERSYVSGGVVKNKIFGRGKDMFVITPEECKKYTIKKIQNKDDAWKNVVATKLFFILFDESIINYLNVTLSWRFLLSENKIDMLKMWIDVSFSKSEVFENVDDTRKLREIFQKWKITDEMINAIHESDCFEITKQTLFDHLTKYGYFLDTDKYDILKIVSRFCRTKTITDLDGIILKSPTLNASKFYIDLTHFCSKHKLYNVVISCIDQHILKAEFENSLMGSENMQWLRLWISINNMFANLDEDDCPLDALNATTKYLNNSEIDSYLISNPIIFIAMLLLNKDCNFYDVLTNNSNFEMGGIMIDHKTIKRILNNMPSLEYFISNVIEGRWNQKPDITLYQLVSEYKLVDISDIFSFQLKNNAENDALPHFGNDSLVYKYGHRERLSYVYYLKQRRPCYASKLFFMEQVKQYGKISRKQQNFSGNIAHALALKNFTNSEITCSCISFIEIIGGKSDTCRSNITAGNVILDYYCTLNAENSYDENKAVVDGILNKLITNRENGSRELLFRLEMATAAICKNDNLADVLIKWNTPVQLAKLHKLTLPELFLSDCSASNNWLWFIIFVQTFDYPLSQVLEWTNKFKDETLRNHLSHALRYEVEYVDKNTTNSKIKPRDARKVLLSKIGLLPGPSVLNPDVMTSSSSSGEFLLYSPPSNNDCVPVCSAGLWGTLLSSTADRCSALLSKCRQGGSPTLALLAACYEPDSLIPCWFMWLSSSVRYTNDSIKNTDSVISMENITHLLCYCVEHGFITSLHESFTIFLPENPLCAFTEFLCTAIVNLNFDSDSLNILKHFQSQIKNLDIPTYQNEYFSSITQKTWLISTAVKMSNIALSYQYRSVYHQKKFIKCLCEAKLFVGIKPAVDYCFLTELLETISNTNVHLNLMNVCLTNADDTAGEELQKLEFKRCFDELIAQKYFDQSLKFANLIGLSTERVVIAQLTYKCDDYILNDSELDLQVWHECNKTFQTAMIHPNMVVEFYTKYSNKTKNVKLKYELLRMTIGWLELDNTSIEEIVKIEIKMWSNYLLIDDLCGVTMHHSKTYKERPSNLLKLLIFDLKEQADIEKLTVTNYVINNKQAKNLDSLISQLLTVGDFALAFRLQTMFGAKNNDVQLLITLMALAEGALSPYQLTAEQRMMLMQSESARTASGQFGRRTLRSMRLSSTSSVTFQHTPNQYLDTTQSTVMTEYVEIPSREKQDTLCALEGLAARMNSGRAAGQRIVLLYRAAMHMDKDYSIVMKCSNVLALLKDGIEEDCMNKLIVASDLMEAEMLSSKQIAEFLASEIASAVIQSRLPKSRLEKGKIANDILWGFDTTNEFHLFLTLCQDSSLLGTCLLEYITNIQQYKISQLLKTGENENKTKTRQRSHTEDEQIQINIKSIIGNSKFSYKQVNAVSVELLTRAHDCFSHSCDMEGIAHVLNQAHILCKQLLQSKSWALMVKLLTGIARYSEMSYVFEMLKTNDQFECLLGQFDYILAQHESKVTHLKMSLLEFLKKKCLGDSDYFRMVALHFLMYSDVAKLWQDEAYTMISHLISIAKLEMADSGLAVTNSDKNGVQSQCQIFLTNSEDTRKCLNTAMNYYTHSAEYYLQDNKLTQAAKAAHEAELIALQLSLLGPTAASAVGLVVPTVHCILHLERMAITHLITHELSFSQAVILSRGYGHPTDWGSALYQQSVLNGNGEYLLDYSKHLDVSASLAQELSRRFMREPEITRQMAMAMRNIVVRVSSVAARYRLASQLGLRDVTEEILASGSLPYLKDTVWTGSKAL